MTQQNRISLLELAELAGTKKHIELAKENKWPLACSYDSLIRRASKFYSGLEKEKGRKEKYFTYTAKIVEIDEGVATDEIGTSFSSFCVKSSLKSAINGLLYLTLSDEELQNKLQEEIPNFIISEDGIGMPKSTWLKHLGLTNRVVVEASKDFTKRKRMGGLLWMNGTPVQDHMLTEVFKQEDLNAKNRFKAILNLADDLVIEEIPYAKKEDQKEPQKLSESELHTINKLKIKAAQVTCETFKCSYELRVLDGSYATTATTAKAQQYFRGVLKNMLAKMNIKYLLNILFIKTHLTYKVNKKYDDIKQQIKTELIRTRIGAAKTREKSLTPKERKYYDMVSEIGFSSDEESIIAVAQSKLDNEYASDYATILNFIWSEDAIEVLNEMDDTSEINVNGTWVSKAKIEEMVQTDAEIFDAKVLIECEHEAQCEYVFKTEIQLNGYVATYGDDATMEEEYRRRAKLFGKEIHVVETGECSIFGVPKRYYLKRKITAIPTKILNKILKEQNKKEIVQTEQSPVKSITLPF